MPASPSEGSAPHGAEEGDGQGEEGGESGEGALQTRAVRAALEALGLDERQVAGVLALADSHLLPLVQMLDETVACEAERGKLVRCFGGEEAWERLGPELLRWGRSALPQEVFEALAATADGVQAMARLRDSEADPSLIAKGGGSGAKPEAEAGDDEASLRRLMADPAYWRRRDPALLARVREGFRRLYPPA